MIRRVSEFLTIDEDQALEALRRKPTASGPPRSEVAIASGWIYSPRTDLVTPDVPTLLLLQELVARVAANGLIERPADQIVFQVYRTGQGLSANLTAAVFH